MINFSILISLSEVEGPGGLFDINATLPLVAIQFILLMVLLNVILYSPLLTVIEERKDYILTNLAEASEKLAQAKALNAEYEEELESARRLSNIEVEVARISFQISVCDPLSKYCEKRIDHLLERTSEGLTSQKEKILNDLDTIVESLCVEVNRKLFS